MRPSRSTTADAGDDGWPLDARQMRETVAIFDDPAYRDWEDLFPLQAAAVAQVEGLLGAPICGKSVVDYYRRLPTDGRLELSAAAIGGQPLLRAQFADLRIVASLPHGETALAAALDLSGDAPAAVLGADAPSLADTADVANPLRAEYRFTAQSPLPQTVLEALATAFRSAFDARYRGMAPLPEAQIAALLAGEAALVGPYD